MRVFVVYGSHNAISGNTSLGLGDLIVEGSRNLVTHNDVVGGEEFGGLGVSGARNLIARNSVQSPEPVLVASGPGNVIRENLVGFEPSASAPPSLLVRGRRGSDDCRNVTIEGNTLHNGMNLNQCRKARVEHNTVASSGVGGIELQGGSGNSIEQNTISRTEEFGILVRGGSRNSVEQNTISDTSLSGIIVAPLFGSGGSSGGSVGTIVRGNLVSRAGFGGGFGDAVDDGVHVEDPGTVIADNRANNNADLGIQAVQGVIDGGGNTAFGNGNPLQCLNVVCN
jgi:parallel beta-helix repeat protein